MNMWRSAQSELQGRASLLAEAQFQRAHFLQLLVTTESRSALLQYYGEVCTQHGRAQALGEKLTTRLNDWMLYAYTIIADEMAAKE